MMMAMALYERQMIWPCDWQTVYDRVVAEPARDASVVRRMRDVKDAAVMKNEWLDGKHHVWLEMESSAKVPGAVLALMPNKKITWIQACVWDPDRRYFHVSVNPHEENQQVVVRAAYTLDDHQQGTLMKAQLSVKASIPLLGGLIEKLVITKVSGSVFPYYEELIREIGS